MTEHLMQKLEFLIVGVIVVAAFIGLVYFRNWTWKAKFTDDLLPTLKKDPEALSAYLRHYNWQLVVLLVGSAFVGVLN